MNYKKMINDFEITGVDEIDGTITVFGEDDSLVCEVSLYDVYRLHPGANGYGSDRDCDRANSYHIDPEDLWKDRSDKGDPASMVSYVWDDLPKKWMNEDDEEIIFPPNHSDMRWIRVEDRIPTEDKEYLAITRYKYIPSYMDGIEWLAVGTCYLRSFHTPYSADQVESAVVVMWMEMPEFKI